MADLLRLSAFGAAISLTSAVMQYSSPSSTFQTAERLRFQPPSWVFGVVWPVLFVLTGVAWVLVRPTHALDACFSSLTVLCCLWLPLYVHLQWYKVATIVLVLSVAVAVTVLLLATSDWKWLVLPLAVWLAFATYLNAVRAVGVPNVK